ncbi:hypothetical protein Rhow_000317 [Rhodococcus wratislaviensis]|uniref:Uncharacterized protein n=1 Tax=Rhodococcus wratislaviensis TaxID=44752 RepID=A0A402CLV7_RHOWR|nr:hypothetical protein Rhow_000317 [Rhodococcus wratislaviensis]
MKQEPRDVRPEGNLGRSRPRGRQQATKVATTALAPYFPDHL